jgi:hypothetical protein
MHQRVEILEKAASNQICEVRSVAGNMTYYPFRIAYGGKKARFVSELAGVEPTPPPTVEQGRPSFVNLT